MNAEDRKVVETTCAAGVCVLLDVFTGRELDEVRRDFDQAYLDDGQGPGEPGTRDSITGESLLKYPALARLFIHPRILGVLSAILDEPRPWILNVKTNRYTPEHPGVNKHTDGFKGAIVPPFTRQCMAVFLDDISTESGALTYVPGTHLLYFESPDDPDRQAPTQEEIEAGDYIPAELTAGSVLFRVPEVWHAVNPIHHLRRYITAPYASRGDVGSLIAEKISQTVEERKQIPIEEIPEEVGDYWVF